MKAKRLSKKAFLEHWRGMKRKRKLAPEPVPYKHEGSTFAHDGIRITGSRKFIDAILSRLTELLEYENGETRLDLNYQQATDRETGRPLDSWSCYIKVHERGDEAKMVNAFASALSGQNTIVSRNY
jgi:hypothetical protein